MLETNPKEVTTEDLMNIPSFKKFITNNKEAEESLTTRTQSKDIPTKTPEETIDENYRYITSNLVDNVLELVLQQNFDFLERLVTNMSWYKKRR